MVLGEPVRRGVGGDLVQPQRLRPVDDQPEQTVPAGQLADQLTLVVADAVVDERPQRVLGAGAEDPERRVAGAGQLAGDLDDPGEQTVEGQVRGDADHGVEQELEPALVRHHPVHPLEQLAQQVVELGPGERREGGRGRGVRCAVPTRVGRSVRRTQ